MSFVESGKHPDMQFAFQDCKRLINRNLDVIYNFPKSEIYAPVEDCQDEYKRKQRDCLQAWFLSSGTSGCGYSESSTTFNSTAYPERPVKTNFLNGSSLERRNAIYLLSGEDHKLMDTLPALIGGVGEEIRTLNKMFVDEDYNLHRLYNIQDKDCFAGWQQFDQDGHILPTSDILILDRFLFGGKNDNIQEIDLENNLYKILALFAEKQRFKLNIVFFTDGIRNKEIWKSRKRRIEQIFKNRNKNISVKVSFILYSRSFPKYRYDIVKRLYPHDRIILTNYRMFRSGDTFCYYDSKGNIITNGLHLDVDSLSHIQNYNYMKSIIKYAQEIYDEIKAIGNDDLIYGDKESNYIRF